MSVWGTVPAWMSAVGSVLALAFAAVAVVISRRTFKANEEARSALEASARRSQAALVSAWWIESPTGKRGAVVRNVSEAPVYQSYLTVLGVDNQTEELKEHLGVLPPSDETHFWPAVTNGLSPQVGGRRVTLSFTDAAGVRWLRNQYGTLVELSSKLQVKADPTTVAELSLFREDFFSAYGVAITFQEDPDNHAQDKYVAEVERSPTLDALLCPHDWIGDLISHGVLQSIVISQAQRNAFPAWSLAALTAEGRLYGLPTTIDTVALFRNTDMVPDLPHTFDDLVANGIALRRAGRVTEVFTVRVGADGDPFQIWPLFTSAGGWLFGQTRDGSWDPTHVGIGTPESIAAFDQLRRYGEAGLGYLRRSMDRREAVEKFVSGASPYLISTSDALQPLLRAKLPFAVSAVPPFSQGRPASALTLVHGLLFSKFGTNTITAQDLFADYMTNIGTMAALSEHIAAPVALRNAEAKDPALRAFKELCGRGTPIPSFAEMGATWRILEQAQVSVISGDSAEKAAHLAASRLADIFSGWHERRQSTHA